MIRWTYISFCWVVLSVSRTNSWLSRVIIVVTASNTGTANLFLRNTHTHTHTHKKQQQQQKTTESLFVKYWSVEPHDERPPSWETKCLFSDHFFFFLKKHLLHKWTRGQGPPLFWDHFWSWFSVKKVLVFILYCYHGFAHNRDFSIKLQLQYMEIDVLHDLCFDLSVSQSLSLVSDLSVCLFACLSVCLSFLVFPTPSSG